MNKRSIHERYQESPGSLRPNESVITTAVKDGLGGVHPRIATADQNGAPQFSVPIGADALPITTPYGNFEIYRIPAGNSHLNLAALDNTPLEKDDDGNLFLRIRMSSGYILRLITEKVALPDGEGGAGAGLDAAQMTNVAEGGERAAQIIDDNLNLILNAAFGPATVSITDADSPYDAGLITTIFADATAGAITINLPDIDDINQRQYRIIKIDASANKVIVTPDGTQKVNGAAKYELTTQYQAAVLEHNSSNWFKTAA